MRVSSSAGARSWASYPFIRVFARPFRKMGLAACLALLGLSFFLAASGFQTDGFYDTDGWFLLTSGREVVTNGVPRTNPWSVTSGNAVVIQQWLHDVVLYGAWKVLGFQNIWVMGAFMLTAVATSLVFAVQAVSSDAKNPYVAIFLASIALFTAGLYVSVRPTAWSMCAMALTVGICAKWSRSHDGRLLAILPLISFLHVNLQAALAPLDLFVAVLFLFPTSSTESSSGFIPWFRSRVPLLAAIAVMAAATLLNPYGIDGALYVFKSIGEAEYGNAISEMKPIWEQASIAWVFVSFYAALPVAAALGKRRALEPPLSLLSAASFVAACLHWRNIWILAIASVLTASSVMDGKPEVRAKALPSPVLCLLVGCFLIEALANTFLLPQGAATWETDGAKMAPVVTAIERSAGGGTPLVYAEDPIFYSYMEWRGLKVPVDLRPEIWSPSITHRSGDPWRDYIDSRRSKKALLSHLRETGIDFIVSDSSISLPLAAELHAERIPVSSTQCLYSVKGGS